MTRRKGLLKILYAVLAVLLLAVCFAGCGEYKPPANSGGNTPVTPVDPENPVTPVEDGFTVKLVFRDVLKYKDEEGNDVEELVETPFTSLNYSLITRLQAQWTEVTDGRAEVYRASFDKDGVAKIRELDGDFNVTLVLTGDFNRKYCYDPNPYDRVKDEPSDDLVASRYKKDVTVPIYEIKSMTKSKQPMHFANGTSFYYYTLTETGAYSYELNSNDDRQFFMFAPTLQGEYSFMTLMDVTADEINPIVDLHTGSSQFISPTPYVVQDDGGTEGNYTKNVWLKYQLAENEVGGVMIFNLHSQSEMPDAYPLTIYFIFERDGEYTRPRIESTPVPITEDFSKTPSKPAGTLELAGDSSLFGNTPDAGTRKGVHILNQKKVRYNDPARGGDGYYYYINPETDDFFRDGDGKVVAQYRLYAVITEPIPVLANEDAEGKPVPTALNNGQLAQNSYYWVQGVDGTFKNYYDFIMGMNGYAYYSQFNPDGAYPVNAELKQFLQDFAVSQRYFNDGNGFAEDSAGAGYNSDEDSQWLFACGLYVN